MKYQVTAQSNDAVVMAFEAKNMFDAAQIAGNELNADIAVNSSNQIYLQFEGENDYYTISQA